MLNIRTIHSDEIPLLADLTPPTWNTNLAITFGFHFGQPYFYPVAAELDGKLVGCANGLWNGNAGWLGNIVVALEVRGQGIGKTLTQNLMDFFCTKGCTNQILIATEMGEPVYRNLGFEITSRYVVLKTTEPCTNPETTNIRPYTSEDRQAIFHIDRVITGEDRHLFLERFLSSGWVHESAPGMVDGFFLPDLSLGPILAEGDAAGLALLSFKLSRGCQGLAIPEANTAARSFLLERGFQETALLPRMALGPEADWQPERVYSRGGGYCG